MIAAVLCGPLDALAMPLQGLALSGLGSFPVQAVRALPYLRIVVLLAGCRGRATLPRASGQRCVKEP